MPFVLFFSVPMKPSSRLVLRLSPSLAKARKATRRKVFDRLEYFQRVKRLMVTLHQEEFRTLVRYFKAQGRQVTRRGLAPFLVKAAFATLDRRPFLPDEVSQSLAVLGWQTHQVANGLQSIAERLSSAQRSLIFDPLEAKKKVQRLYAELEKVILTCLANGGEIL